MASLTESQVTRAMSCPSIRICPDDGSNWRRSSFTSVLLPAPDGPTSATFSPGVLTVEVEILEQLQPVGMGEIHLAELRSRRRARRAASRLGRSAVISCGWVTRSMASVSVPVYSKKSSIRFGQVPPVHGDRWLARVKTSVEAAERQPSETAASPAPATTSARACSSTAPPWTKRMTIRKRRSRTEVICSSAI